MKLKLVQVKNESPDTKTFYFESDEEIKYTSGQYFYFTIPNLKYEDDRGNTRHFTLSSSPTEKLISFTTKFLNPMSGYKQTLLELKIGDVVEGKGPNGTFVLPNRYPLITNHLFIAGGIGITPFRSIIKYITDKKINAKIYLIYSNSDNKFVFKEDFSKIPAEFVDSSKSGHLGEVKIKKLIENWSLAIDNCTFWLCGPPPFIDAVENALEKIGVTSAKIRSEKFTGY